MRIEIEIPKEFEEHFKQDKFEDTLYRLNADAHLIAGNYEKETAIMLIKAFKDSKQAYDVNAVVAEIKKHSYFMGIRESMVETIVRIVRKGGVE